jgi:hypothetical protein
MVKKSHGDCPTQRGRHHTFFHRAVNHHYGGVTVGCDSIEVGIDLTPESIFYLLLVF